MDEVNTDGREAWKAFGESSDVNEKESMSRSSMLDALLGSMSESKSRFDSPGDCSGVESGGGT